MPPRWSSEDDYYNYGPDIWGPSSSNSSNWDFTNSRARTGTASTQAEPERPDWLGSLGNFGLGRGMETATPEAVTPQRRQLAPPVYDYGPMQRYQEYLKDEPERAAYQPRGWDKLLNAAAAGVRGFQTGDVGAGLKLGNELREQPYQEAFKRWQSKGGRYQADATMAETRNRNAETAYQRDVTNAREDRRTAIDEQRLQMQIQESKDRGFQFRPGDDGKMIAYRVKDGKTEVLPTNISNDDYTLAEKKAEKLLDRATAEKHFENPSGSALLAARTAAANTAANNKSREGAWSYSHGSGDDPINPNLPGDTNTPPKLLKAFGEFNDPFMVSVSGNRMSFTPKWRSMSDEEKDKYLEIKSKRTGVDLPNLQRRLREFIVRSQPMLLPEPE